MMCRSDVFWVTSQPPVNSETYLRSPFASQMWNHSSNGGILRWGSLPPDICKPFCSINFLDACRVNLVYPTLQAKALLQLMSVKRPPSPEILVFRGMFCRTKMFFHKGCLLPCVVLASERPWSPHRCNMLGLKWFHPRSSGRLSKRCSCHRHLTLKTGK